MKTVKFKDLPEKVREFLVRSFGFKQNAENDVLTGWLHTCPEWSKATDEERLAYAYWKYPRGVKFIDQETNGALTSAGESFSIAWFYDFKTHKWAEIIEDKEEEPTFKSGDEVTLDGSDANTVFKIVHIQDQRAWIKTEGMVFGRLVMLYRLRKPDPDKVYREIAKEIMKRYMLVELFPDKIESMLIEAIKKGKEL